MNIIIAGEGKEIHFLIKSFTSKEHEVIVINKNEETCKKIARIHETITVVCGDSTKLERVWTYFCKLVLSMIKFIYLKV